MLRHLGNDHNIFSFSQRETKNREPTTLLLCDPDELGSVASPVPGQDLKTLSTQACADDPIHVLIAVVVNYLLRSLPGFPGTMQDIHSPDSWKNIFRGRGM